MFHFIGKFYLLFFYFYLHCLLNIYVFDSIPKNKSVMNEKWVLTLKEWGINAKSYMGICSGHFSEKDVYYKPFKGEICRFIIPGRIPTIQFLYTKNSNERCVLFLYK